MPKDFLCNSPMCWCIVLVSVSPWLAVGVFNTLGVIWASCFPTGSSLNKFTISPTDFQRETNAFCLGTKLYGKPKTVGHKHPYPDSLYQMSNIRQKLAVFDVTVGMGKCSCVKWGWEKWAWAGGLSRALPLFAERLCRLKADSARNLVLTGKHPWSILVIILLLEWTKDGDPMWFNSLFQWGYYSKYPLASYSKRKKILLP